MPIVLRKQKGSPLTAAEVDGNFEALLMRIEQLEKLRPFQENLAEIKTEGDELILKGTLGSELGRVQLPSLKMMPRGGWRTGEIYALNDLVTYNGCAYICLQSHHSLDFEKEKTKWMTLFSFEQTSQAQVGPRLPLLTTDKMMPPVFGTLAIFAQGDTLELLLGDVTCWRRVRDMQEFNIEKGDKVDTGKVEKKIEKADTSKSSSKA
jgi:hypothetical protein